uniref:Ku_N domain-containing protein n=1 Tax=Glossina brevipalpis TaxID=37001 RepID=A0A1A9W3S0_9MUSC
MLEANANLLASLQVLIVNNEIIFDLISFNTVYEPPLYAKGSCYSSINALDIPLALARLLKYSRRWSSCIHLMLILGTVGVQRVKSVQQLLMWLLFSIDDYDGKMKEDGSDHCLKPTTYNYWFCDCGFVDGNLLSEEPSRFKHALNIIRSAFLSGLLFNDKDVVGLVFANTDKNPEPYEPNYVEDVEIPDNCMVFLPVRQFTKAIVDHYLRARRAAGN